MWSIAAVVCLVLALIVAVRAIKDQRSKGRGPIGSFLIGCVTGGFFGAFLLVVLFIAQLILGGA